MGYIIQDNVFQQYYCKKNKKARLKPKTLCRKLLHNQKSKDISVIFGLNQKSTSDL